MKVLRLIKKHYAFSIIIILSSFLWVISLSLYNNSNQVTHDRLLDLETVRVEAYYHQYIQSIIHDLNILQIYVQSSSESLDQESFTSFIESQEIFNDEYLDFSIALLSDDETKLVQEFLYPYDINSYVLGHDLLADDREYFSTAVNKALDGVIAFSGPNDLIQGEQGIVFRKSVVIEEEAFGMVSIVIDYDKIKEKLLLDSSEVVSASVFNEDKLIVFGALEYSESIDYYSDIAIDGVNWTIGISETQSFHDSYINNIMAARLLAVVIYIIAFSTGLLFYRKINRLILEQESLIYYDKLTKLPTRRKLNDDVQASIDAKQEFFLGFGDLDNFKNLNDILGHSIGDRYLAEVANRFNSVSGDCLEIYRWGGDEFIFFFKSSVKEETIELLDSIYSSLKNPIVLNDLDYNISLSIGIVNYPDQGDTLDDLIKKADIVMYDVKGNQKNQYAFFEDKYMDKLLREVDFENKLNEYCLDDFKVYLQPLIDVQSNEIVGVEALTRLFDRNNNIVNTGEIIKYYERNGKITSLDYKVFETVCNFKKQIKEEKGTDLFYSFNMSPLSLTKETIDYFEETVLKFDLDPSKFVIEIIETIGFKDINESIILLTKLKDIGFKIAMDDFGMGYSSLSYIAKLPLAIIKIDKTFIDNYAENKFDRLLIHTIKDISKSLDLKIIVEGIETIEQLAFIKEIKCHYYQGYYHSKAMSFDEFLKLV